MTAIRFPRPLRPGDRVGVTSPSSGVDASLSARLGVAVDVLRDRGLEVVVGDCMDGSRHVSAPAVERAAELTRFLTDPSIVAVVPPWGGELAIDLLPLLDFEALRAAEPTWFVGFSDISTLLVPLTLRTQVATVHGNNLMDTPYRVPAGLLSWLDVVTAPTGAELRQVPPGRYRRSGWDDWAANPAADEYDLDATGRWQRLDGEGDVRVEGRLIGGCIETISNLAGTPYLDLTGLPDGPLLVYVEAAEADAFQIGRNLHGLRLAGFFDRAAAILVGRTAAPNQPTMSQHEAVLDALGGLGVPLVADVECGHVPPYLPLVNGAVARLVHTGDESSLTQYLR